MSATSWRNCSCTPVWKPWSTRCARSCWRSPELSRLDIAGHLPRRFDVMDIAVTLRDAADGGVIARTVVPSESLPPAFDGTRMLEAAGQVWRVVRAEPA